MNGQQTGTSSEVLTQREMDVLALLAKGLSNQEIAESLVMEVGTVKWYNTQIYGKLQVENRKQAVTRALTLGILAAETNDPLQRPQHNLPADTLPFIGRRHEIDELVQQLTGEKFRLITILGPGGMGKTRLSIEVGRHLLGQFMDGVYFVPLATVTSAEQIVTTIGETIGFKFHSDVRPKQQLLNYLQQQRMLLIIDNLEHLLESAGLLTDVLSAAPDVKVLVTSREKLGLGGEVEYVIGGLSTPFDESKEIAAHDAVRLFIEAANRTTFQVGESEMGMVARICQMLGGMPLAILLAAAWQDTLSLAEIEAEIGSGMDILEATLRDSPQRHQSIKAVFDYSWERLTDDEQLAFMRLSVFRSGFTREAAQAVTGASLRDLQRLVHTSFLQRLASGRYAIHELMRQYGEQKLHASGDFTTLRENHARYFAELFRPVGEAGWLGVDTETLEAVNPDFENVRAAWHFHLERKDVSHLRQVIDGIWVFLDEYSRSQEAIDLFEAALEVFRNEDGDEANLFRGELVALMGWFSGDIGLKARAFELTDQALAILLPYGATDALLLAYAGHSIFLAMANERQRSMDEITEGLELARTMGDSRWEGIFCYLMGSACLAMGNYEEALRWAELMPEEPRLGIKGSALNKLGDYAQAEVCLLQVQSMGGRHRYGRAMNGVALMENAVLRGNLEQAWIYLQRALQVVDDVAYAWAALVVLQISLSLFSVAKLHNTAVEVLSLIVHHPNTMENTRARLATYETTLRASLPADEFAAAWERGQCRDLGDLISELMER